MIHEARQEALQGHSILVVEDDPLISWDVEEILKSAGAEVVAARTGVSAMREAGGARLSGAVLDYDAGNQFIHPLCRKLEHRNLPFVFYTASAKAPYLVPVVLKPADPDRIVGAVKFAIAENGERVLVAPPCAAGDQTLSDVIRHIKEGEERVERVKRIIVRLSESGFDTSAAYGLISAMNRTLEIMRERQRTSMLASWKPNGA